MYPVTTETKTTTYLTINKGGVPIYEQGNKQVIGTRKPSVGYPFAYNGKNNYSFGCANGKFTYAQLLLAIRGAEQSDTKGPTIQSIKKIDAKPSSAMKTPIKVQAGGFFILENNKAYSETEYEQVAVTLPGSKDFAGFKFNKVGNWSNDAYKYKGYSTGLATKKEILEQLLITKAIIDFFEDKGDYAPVVLASATAKDKVADKVA